MKILTGGQDQRAADRLAGQRAEAPQPQAKLGRSSAPQPGQQPQRRRRAPAHLAPHAQVEERVHRAATEASQVQALVERGGRLPPQLAAKQRARVEGRALQGPAAAEALPGGQPDRAPDAPARAAQRVQRSRRARGYRPVVGEEVAQPANAAVTRIS